MTPVLFYSYDSTDLTKNTAVPSVQVRVYSFDGSTFVTMGSTDGDGNLTLDLDDGTYWVRFFKTGYAFDVKLYIVVDSLELNEFDIEATNLLALPPSTGTNLCRASGYAVDAAGQPRPGATFKFLLTEWRRVVGDNAITSAGVYARTDDDGYIEVDLIQGAFYEVSVEGMEDSVFFSYVPATQATNITDLIWPYPARVDSSASAVSVGVEATQEVSVSLVLSSGAEMPIPADSPAGFPSLWILPKSADSNIATVSLSNTTLTITGVSAGVTSVSFTVIGSYEKRLPEVTVSLGEIEVTVI